MPTTTETPQSIDYTKRTFWINSMGEAGQCDSDGIDTLTVGSIDTKEFTTHFHMKHGYPPRDRDFDEEFLRIARADLKPREYELYARHSKLCKEIDGGGLFRFYGSMIDNRPYLFLSTEFYLFDADTELKELVDKWCDKYGFTLDVMHDDTHLDHVTKVDKVKVIEVGDVVTETSDGSMWNHRWRVIGFDKKGGSKMAKLIGVKDSDSFAEEQKPVHKLGVLVDEYGPRHGEPCKQYDASKDVILMADFDIQMLWMRSRVGMHDMGLGPHTVCVM